MIQQTIQQTPRRKQFAGGLVKLARVVIALAARGNRSGLESTNCGAAKRIAFLSIHSDDLAVRHQRILHARAPRKVCTTTRNLPLHLPLTTQLVRAAHACSLSLCPTHQTDRSSSRRTHRATQWPPPLGKSRACSSSARVLRVPSSPRSRRPISTSRWSIAGTTLTSSSPTTARWSTATARSRCSARRSSRSWCVVAAAAAAAATHAVACLPANYQHLKRPPPHTIPQPAGACSFP